MARPITIDTDECIGCQSCVELCPAIFGFNDDEEKAFVIDGDGDRECAADAAASCPAECISVD